MGGRQGRGDPHCGGAEGRAARVWGAQVRGNIVVGIIRVRQGTVTANLGGIIHFTRLIAGGTGVLAHGSCTVHWTKDEAFGKGRIPLRDKGVHLFERAMIHRTWRTRFGRGRTRVGGRTALEKGFGKEVFVFTLATTFASV